MTSEQISALERRAKLSLKKSGTNVSVDAYHLLWLIEQATGGDIYRSVLDSYSLRSGGGSHEHKRPTDR